MITETELNAKIMATLLEIREKKPERYKFLNEMPVTIPNVNHPEINTKILEDYLESLEMILSKDN